MIYAATNVYLAGLVLSYALTQTHYIAVPIFYTLIDVMSPRIILSGNFRNASFLAFDGYKTHNYYL